MLRKVILNVYRPCFFVSFLSGITLDLHWRPTYLTITDLVEGLGVFAHCHWHHLPPYPLHWPAACARFWGAPSTLVSSGILKNLGCLCMETAGSGSLLWLGESLWDNLALWYYPVPSQDWYQRQIACFCIRISPGSPNPNQNWDHTLWRILLWTQD